MTPAQAVRFFGTHQAVSQVTGTTRAMVGKTTVFRPLAQLRLFIESDGKLHLDTMIDDLVNRVLAIKLQQNDVVCAVERMVEQQQKASACSCDLFRLDGERILEEAIGAIK